MTTDTQTDDLTDGPILAEGVDEEPVEHNRRIFDGRTYLAIAGVSAFYALFHMAALNGWSIRGWTGVDIPLLPVYIDGAFEALPRGNFWPKFNHIKIIFGKPYASDELKQKGFSLGAKDNY